MLYFGKKSSYNPNLQCALDSILSNRTFVHLQCCQIESKQIFVGPADSKLNSKLHVLHMHKKQCPEGASTAAVFATNFA